MTDIPRPPAVDHLLAAVTATLPPCCPANWAEDIEEHAADCSEWELDRIRAKRNNRNHTTKDQP